MGPLHDAEILAPSELRLFQHLNARAEVLQAGMLEVQAAIRVLLVPYAMQQGDQITDDGTLVRGPAHAALQGQIPEDD